MWIIVIEVILWYLKNPLISKFQFLEMPYYMFMSIAATILPIVIFKTFELIPAEKNYSILVHALFSLLVSFALWSTEKVSKKAKIGNTQVSRKKEISSILLTVVFWIASAFCVISLSSHITSCIFSSKGIITLSVIIITDCILLILKKKVTLILNISGASYYMLMAATASFIGGILLQFDNYITFIYKTGFLTALSLYFALTLMIVDKLIHPHKNERLRD